MSMQRRNSSRPRQRQESERRPPRRCPAARRWRRRRRQGRCRRRRLRGRHRGEIPPDVEQRRRRRDADRAARAVRLLPDVELVIGGSKTIDFVTIRTTTSAAMGHPARPRHRHGGGHREADGDDGGGQTFAYDRLIVAPGIEFMWDAIRRWRRIPRPHRRSRRTRGRRAADGAAAPAARGDAGRRRRRDLDPKAPTGAARALRARLPGRVVLKARKPRSKVLILDGNEDVQSKKGLFMKVWGEDYKGSSSTAELRPHRRRPCDEDAQVRDQDDVKATVANVIPPQRPVPSPAAPASSPRTTAGARSTSSPSSRSR